MSLKHYLKYKSEKRILIEIKKINDLIEHYRLLFEQYSKLEIEIAQLRAKIEILEGNDPKQGRYLMN